MTDWASLRSCQELTDAQIGEVIESRDDVRVLLDHLSHVARPGQGGPRVLLLFARMASPECDWLEGALQLSLRGDGMGTTVESFALIGGGLRERVVPKVVLPVPIDEFLDVIARFPHLIAPLAVLEASGSHAILEAREAEHRLRDSEMPDDAEADALDAAEARERSRGSSVVPLTAFDLPAVRRQRPIPKAPLVGLPVVLPESASAPGTTSSSVAQQRAALAATQIAPTPRAPAPPLSPPPPPPPVAVAPPPAPRTEPPEPPVRSTPPVRPPPRSRAPVAPPPKRTQVVLGKITKPSKPKPPVEDERREAVARRHPAADPTEPPPARRRAPAPEPPRTPEAVKPPEPAPAPSRPRDSEDVDGGWD